MALVKSNLAKWHNFADGDRLYGDSNEGHDLDHDLQENIADEIDSILDTTVGECVLASNHLRVAPSNTAMAVTVFAGWGVVLGQRIWLNVNYEITSLSPSTTYYIYAEIDTDQGYDTYVSGWSAKITYRTSGTPTGNYLLLAVVATPSISSVIPVASITDKRNINETQRVMAATINDQVVPADAANSVRRRLGMFAYRFREIIGVANWKDAVPASLTTVWGKFNGTSGHAHSGGSNDGAKINASNVTLDTNTVPGSTDTSPVIGVTATNLKNAVYQLATRKLSINGTQAMTGKLTLHSDPTMPLHAATKQYVDQAVRVKQLVKGTIPSGKTVAYGTPATMLANTVSITTLGGVLKFEAGTGVTAAPESNGTYPWDPFLHFYLYRNGSQIQTQSIEILMNPTLEVSSQFIFIPIPVFYDNPPSGDYVYDLRWNFSIPVYPTPTLEYNFSTGRLDTEGNASYWYIIEQ